MVRLCKKLDRAIALARIHRRVRYNDLDMQMIQLHK